MESYMDDFIDKVAFGLNAVFSNGVDYPQTNWLLLDGAKDELAFKDLLRANRSTPRSGIRRTHTSPRSTSPTMPPFGPASPAPLPTRPMGSRLGGQAGMAGAGLALELDDIQGIVVRGYSRHRRARYSILRINDAGAARNWLGSVAW